MRGMYIRWYRGGIIRVMPDETTLSLKSKASPLRQAARLHKDTKKPFGPLSPCLAQSQAT